MIDYMALWSKPSLQTNNLKQLNIMKNWNDAIKQNNFHWMHTIAILIGHINKTQNFQYKESLKLGKFISDAVLKLTKNDNAINLKINMVLVQLISSFYTKFNHQQDFTNLLDYLSNTIEAVENLLLINQNNLKNVKSLKQCQQYQSALKHFQHTISIDEEQSGLQFCSQSEHIFIQFSQKKLFHALMSTLIFIKLKFLSLLKNYQGIGDLIDKIEVNLIKKFNEQQFTSNHKIFLAFIQPLLYFMPQIMQRCISNQEKRYVYQKLLIRSITLLDQQITECENSVDYQLDFVRVFKSTNFLNEIEIVLVHFKEDNDKIQYGKVLQQFQKISRVKRRLIKNIEDLRNKFMESWSGKNSLIQRINSLSNKNDIFSPISPSWKFINVIDKITFITYFNLHHHPYQVMNKLGFSESSCSNINFKGLNYIFCGSRQASYPQFINISVYQIKEYQHLHFAKTYTQNQFKSWKCPNQQIRQKRQKNIQYLIKNQKSNSTLQNPYQNDIVLSRIENKNKQIQNGMIYINLFPLSDNILIKTTLESLTQCLQIWITLVNTKMKYKYRSKKRKENPFNEKVFQLENPYLINVKGLKDSQGLDYLFSLIFDLMVVLSQSKQGDAFDYGLKDFYDLFFKELDITHRAMLLFYLYQLGSQHYQFSQLLFELVQDIFHKKEIEEILRFFILDLKLNCAQLIPFYTNTYSILSQKCFMTLKNVSDILVSIYADQQKNHQHVKTKFQKQFIFLKDIVFLWMINTFSKIKNHEGLSLYYCSQCSYLVFKTTSNQECKSCFKHTLQQFVIHQSIQVTRYKQKMISNFKNQINLAIKAIKRRKFFVGQQQKQTLSQQMNFNNYLLEMLNLLRE